ncbi:MmcQ/YjbR family DNA-binding protein [Nocardioides hwasunensis]|uniref:MmcQ/YjbR family DNA-binding protein n=1 Tax=Nocardioides hwasunensis TaxID=397258 RepID=A0ABR8MN66_9ACTN|nr:MmcQ/YjbR family DNA-binding protein [Nocardioides hwasunensis]MBD3916260.1 MmcQ/YjbR family DNA-binding protein [Nocardioides hwasunensis]
MAVVDDVLPLGSSLDRSYVVRVQGRRKFRVGSIVYVAFSPHETVMGFAFPKEERAALVASDPRFQLPDPSDLRFNWVHATLAELDALEARELVVDAWRMVVPQRLSRAWDQAHPDGPGPG